MTGADVKAAKESEGGMEASMRLKSTINETNMVLFDHDGKIHKYKNVVEIMQEFAKVRLKYYDVRKKYLVDKLTLEKDLLSNRARFIGLICAKKLHVNNRKKADLVKDLTRLKFTKFGDTKEPRTGYEYLLIMHIVSLTLERKRELEKLLELKTHELNRLKKTTIQTMWSEDLDRLEAAVQPMCTEEGDGGADGKASKGKRGKKRGRQEDDGQATGGEVGEDGEAGEGEGVPAQPSDDVFGSHFSDVSRWTACHLKLPSSNIRKKAKH